ncbi:hypothetical protein D9M69_452740 [compost metagenome]
MAKAVPCTAGWVKLAITAPAGPNVPVTTSMARAMTTSCATPGDNSMATDSNRLVIRQ